MFRIGSGKAADCNSFHRRIGTPLPDTFPKRRFDTFVGNVTDSTAGGIIADDLGNSITADVSGGTQHITAAFNGTGITIFVNSDNGVGIRTGDGILTESHLFIGINGCLFVIDGDDVLVKSERIKCLPGKLQLAVFNHGSRSSGKQRTGVILDIRSKGIGREGEVTAEFVGHGDLEVELGVQQFFVSNGNGQTGSRGNFFAVGVINTC